MLVNDVDHDRQDSVEEFGNSTLFVDDGSAPPHTDATYGDALPAAEFMVIGPSSSQLSFVLPKLPTISQTSCGCLKKNW